MSRNTIWIAVATLVAVMATTRSAAEPRLSAHGSSFLNIDLPASLPVENATIVFAENEPLAFLALGFPPSARFVRIAGNFLGPPHPEYAMDHEAGRRLAGADGRMYAVLAKPDSAQVTSALARQNLAVEYPCAPVHSNLLAPTDTILLCPLERAR